MSLEDLAKEERDVVERHMLRTGIDRNGIVNSGKFYEDVCKWAGTLQKDHSNPDTYRKAGREFHGDQEFYYTAKTDVRPLLENIASILTENRARHGLEDYSTITSGFSDEHWMSLISNLPLYKTKNKGYDEIITILNQKRQMDEIAKDPKKMAQFIFERSQNLGQAFYGEFKREKFNESYIKTRFSIYQREVEIKYMNAFFTKEGIKKGLAKSIFEASLLAAKHQMDKETNEGDKGDIWDDVKTHYLTLCDIQYQLNKEAKEIDDEKNKPSTTQERKKDREEMGMRK